MLTRTVFREIAFPLFMTGRTQSKHKHLGRDFWHGLLPQPEPKIATYLCSIIEVDFFSSLSDFFLTLSCHRHHSRPFQILRKKTASTAQEAVEEATSSQDDECDEIRVAVCCSKSLSDTVFHKHHHGAPTSPSPNSRKSF